MSRPSHLKYILVPYRILKSDLSHNEQKVMANILSINQNGGEYKFDNQFVADYLNCSKRTASRVVNSLVSKGLIASTIYYKPNSKQGHYRVLSVTTIGISEFGDTPNDTIGDTPIDQTGKDNIISINNKKDNNNSESFEKFWNLYNKKIGHKKCKQIWKRINKNLHPEIFEHVKKYVESTPDINFRKNPQTYLNGECWNDEIRDSKEDNSVPTQYSRWSVK